MNQMNDDLDQEIFLKEAEMMEIPGGEMGQQVRKRGKLQDFCAIYGDRFSIEWNKLYKRGQVPRMCKKFNLTYEQVCRVRRMLHLPKVHKTTSRAKIKWKFNKAVYKRVNIRNLATHYGCSVSFVQNNKSVNYLERKNDTTHTKAILADPKEFKDFWYQAKMKKGYYKKVMKKFGLTWGSVLYVKKTLHLRDVGVTKVRRDIEAKICKLYAGDLSSEQIGKRVGMCSELVRIILAKHGVAMKPAHVTNAKYFKTQSHLTTSKLLSEIKRLYVEEKMPCVQIAKLVGVWEGTVSSKLKAMGFEIVTRRKMPNDITIKPNYNIIGIYKGTHDPYVLWNFSGTEYEFNANQRKAKGEARNCLWCNKPFNATISVGPRSQKFCCHQCKNKAKDLRRGLQPRFLKGKMRPASAGRFTKLALEFTGDINQLGLSTEVAEKVKELREATPTNETITQGLDIQD